MVNRISVFATKNRKSGFSVVIRFVSLAIKSDAYRGREINLLEVTPNTDQREKENIVQIRKSQINMDSLGKKGVWAATTDTVS